MRYYSKLHRRDCRVTTNAHSDCVWLEWARLTMRNVGEGAFIDTLKTLLIVEKENKAEASLFTQTEMQALWGCFRALSLILLY